MTTNPCSMSSKKEIERINKKKRFIDSEFERFRKVSASPKLIASLKPGSGFYRFFYAVKMYLHSNCAEGYSNASEGKMRIYEYLKIDVLDLRDIGLKKHIKVTLAGLQSSRTIKKVDPQLSFFPTAS